MSDVIRLGGQVHINVMQEAYRKRFEGNEADIRFNPNEALTLDVRVQLPTMIRAEDLSKEAGYLVNRMASQLARDLAGLFEDKLAQKAK